MAKQVLITGGAGFIGSHLSERCISAGYTVFAVDNFLTGQEKNIAQLRNHPSFHFIQADVTQPPASYLPPECQPEIVLHFASPASPGKYQAHPVETYLVNSYATHLLLTHMKTAFPHATFVFASTSEVYGDPVIHPQTETYWGNVNPNGVRSCYDEAKRLGETICGVHFRDFGLDVRIVRIFNTYGPRMDAADGRVIPQFIAEALSHKPLSLFGDGSQTRSYCYVDDLVEGIFRVATSQNLAGETINLGNPEEYTIKQTALLVARAVEPESSADPAMTVLPLPKDDPTRRKPDITKAQRLLQWSPTIAFATGLTKTVAYFRSERASQVTSG